MMNLANRVPNSMKRCGECISRAVNSHRRLSTHRTCGAVWGSVDKWKHRFLTSHDHGDQYDSPWWTRFKNRFLIQFPSLLCVLYLAPEESYQILRF